MAAVCGGAAVPLALLVLALAAVATTTVAEGVAASRDVLIPDRPFLQAEAVAHWLYAEAESDGPWAHVNFDSVRSGASIPGDAVYLLDGDGRGAVWRKGMAGKDQRDEEGVWEEVAECGRDARELLWAGEGEDLPLLVVTTHGLVGVALGEDADRGTENLVRGMHWGEVHAADLQRRGPQQGLVVWVAADRGVYALTPSSSSSSSSTLSSAAKWIVTQMTQVTDTPTTIGWHAEWRTLFVGTPSALFQLIDPDTETGLAAKARHDWIGGLFDTELTSISPDYQHDCVWVAENEALHRRDAEGRWWRHGFAQGSSVNNITAIAATSMETASSAGAIWAGAAQGLMRLQLLREEKSLHTAVAQDPAQGFNTPWPWLFYDAPRWMRDSEVRLLVPFLRDPTFNDGSVMIVTSTGITAMEMNKMTLDQKGAMIVDSKQPRHDRYGLTSWSSLDAYGDLSTSHTRPDENDGLWTSMSGMGAAFRAAVSGGDPELKRLAWRAFEGLDLLSKVTDTPGYFARSAAKSTDPGWGGDDWYNSTSMEGWVFNGDTSSDEFCGRAAALPVLLDYAASDDMERERVRHLIWSEAHHLVENDLYLLNQFGEVTTWGVWNPEPLNTDPEWYSERGLNSLQAVAFLSSAYSVTREPIFKEVVQSLITQHEYYLNALNQKIDSSEDDNASDDELGMLTYHTLFYSWWRISATEKPEFKAEMWDIVGPFVKSIQRHMQIVEPDRSPLWTAVVAGVAAQPVDTQVLYDSVETLRLWSMDFIDWDVTNSKRWDCVESPYSARDSTTTLMRNVRPPSERQTSHWNTSPYTMDTGTGGGYREYEPAVWALPFYMMRFYGLVGPPSDES